MTTDQPTANLSLTLTVPAAALALHPGGNLWSLAVMIWCFTLEETAQGNVSTAGISYGDIASERLQIWNHPWELVERTWPGHHSDEAPSALIASLKNTAAQMSPAIVLNFNVLRTSVLERLTRERLMAMLAGFYGVLAAVLAMVGIYGIVSYMVIRRRNEIGVCIALGAGKANILGMILREALALLAVGLVAGTCLAAAAGTAARALLFGISPVDPLTLVLAAAGLTIIVVASSAIPGGRAAGVDPMQVLREE